VTPRPLTNPPPELAAQRQNFRGYALGLDVADYRGRRLVMHTGGLPGYVSRVMMIPELDLGIAVLTNQEAGRAFDAIAFRVADHYLGAPPTDWLDAYQKVAAREAKVTAATEQATVKSRNTASRPSLPPAKYTGTYTDRWYGDIAIEEQGGKLQIRFTRTPSLVGDLEHWQYDTFVARWRDRELRADAFVTFALNPDGTIHQARMQAVSPETDFSFDFQDLLLEPSPPK
jgi:hypothetical protein